MAVIKDEFFHIKGTPTEKELMNTSGHDNYVWASLYYVKGEGYFWRIDTEKHYTYHDEVFGDMTMRAYTIGGNKNWICERLVECKRAGKKKQQEAIEYFDSNVVSAIIHRLGYDVEMVL